LSWSGVTDIAGLRVDYSMLRTECEVSGRRVRRQAGVGGDRKMCSSVVHPEHWQSQWHPSSSALPFDEGADARAAENRQRTADGSNFPQHGTPMGRNRIGDRRDDGPDHRVMDHAFAGCVGVGTVEERHYTRLLACLCQLINSAKDNCYFDVVMNIRCGS
jgi:hypothetical protein